MLWFESTLPLYLKEYRKSIGLENVVALAAGAFLYRFAGRVTLFPVTFDTPLFLIQQQRVTYDVYRRNLTHIQPPIHPEL